MMPIPHACPVLTEADHPHGIDGPGLQRSLGESGPVTRKEAVAAYERAWSLPDEDLISAELERCWTADSTHLSPITDVITGVQALTRLILDLPVMFPGAHFRIITPTDFHHDVGCFAWRLESTARIRMAGHDYGFSAEGLDFLDFDAQNRIRRVVAFYGPSAEPSRGPPRRPTNLTVPMGLRQVLRPEPLASARSSTG